MGGYGAGSWARTTSWGYSQSCWACRGLLPRRALLIGVWLSSLALSLDCLWIVFALSLPFFAFVLLHVFAFLCFSLPFSARSFSFAWDLGYADSIICMYMLWWSMVCLRVWPFLHQDVRFQETTLILGSLLLQVQVELYAVEKNPNAVGDWATVCYGVFDQFYFIDLNGCVERSWH